MKAPLRAKPYGRPKSDTDSHELNPRKSVESVSY